MIKKLLKILFWMTVLIALATTCLGTTMFKGWPLWYVPVLFIATIIILFGLAWAVKHANAWHQRWYIQHNLSESAEKQISDLDRIWKKGMRLLRQSRFKKYALPWFVMLSDSDSGKNTVMMHSGLFSSLRSIDPDDTVKETHSLEWWFLEHSIILNVAGHVLNERMNWKRLLYWFKKTRRQKPVSGVIIAIEIERLMSDNQEQLAQAGLRLRKHLDELVKTFGVHLPVYFVLTGGEQLTGMIKWGAHISEAQRKQPFGLLISDHETDAKSFINHTFTQINSRLCDISLELGQQSQPGADELHLPEQIAMLRLALEQLLLPAFNDNSYCEKTQLAGLFITAEVKDDEGLTEDWFTRELMDNLLPSQRYVYRPINNCQYWHRYMTHASVALWLMACTATGLFFLYGSTYVRDELNIAALPPNKITLSRDLADNIDAINNTRQYIEIQETLGNRLWVHWLPFHGWLDHLFQYEHTNYVATFITQVKQPLFNKALANNMTKYARNNDDNIIAAYTDFLVRRISLIDARLADHPLDQLPGFNDNILLLFRSTLPGQAVDKIRIDSLSDSYKAYLNWQDDRQALREERSRAEQQLDELGLSRRPISWLETWAEQQSNLPTLRYNDFTLSTGQTDGSLPKSYTVEGRNAVFNFLNELQNVMHNSNAWEKQRQLYLFQYQIDTQNAWYRFIDGYLQAERQRILNQNDWLYALSTLGSPNDPHRKLLQRTAQRFALIPQENRSPWVKLTIHLNHLLMFADDPNVRKDNGLVSHLLIANKTGNTLLQDRANNGSVGIEIDTLKTDLALSRTLILFEKKLQSVSSNLLKSDVKAFEVALDSWNFGHDPSAKPSQLWEINDLRESLQKQMQYGSTRESVVWTLAMGGGDLTLAYAGEVASCRLQKDWNVQVLSAVQGVSDPTVMEEILYGENGRLSLFLQGPIKSFIQQGTQSYTPYIVLNQQIPLTGSFYAYVSHFQAIQSELESKKPGKVALQTSQRVDKSALEASDNVKTVTLTYRQQGESELPGNYQQADSMQVQADILAAQIQHITDQLAIIDTQPTVTIAIDQNNKQILQMTPPTQIGRCWSPLKTNPGQSSLFIAPKDEFIVQTIE